MTVHHDIAEILKFNEEINTINDLDALMDHILLAARRFTDADAGSIFLRNDDVLTFSYVQNDTLFSDPAGSKRHLYAGYDLRISEQSIAGYVAKSRETLRIADVYELDPGLPYHFNRSYDDQTQYRTRSVLTIPLISHDKNLTGVLQVINRRDENGRTLPFTEEDETFGKYFAGSAATAIDRARMTRQMILRMIQMAELRDPKETGPHVNRVGAYAIELYDRWARNRGIPDREIRKLKDNLRIAAMLHDVGKIGIPDSILKKPGKLEPDERLVMQYHSIYGARLFRGQSSDLDLMSAEICLTHHEKWDGTGYPGKVPDIYAKDAVMGPGLKGEEIPILGRIVGLCDVFDALSCRRCYKDPWPEEKVHGIIEQDTGKHFDPEVAAAYFSIQDTFRAIREKYQDRE